MNLKVTFILSFVFMAIVSLAVWDNVVLKEKRREKGEAEKLIFSVKDRAVARITIRTKGQETKLECLKLQTGCAFDYTGDWKIVAPIDDQGDSSNIGSLLNNLRSLAPVSRLDATAAEWKDFGLEKPDPELEISLTNGEKLYLGFGMASAIGANRYLRTNTNDKEVFLVADFFPNILQNDLFHWRNKRILKDIDTEAVQTFAWNEIAVKRSGENWVFTKPYSARANKVMVESLLNTLVFGNAKKIAAGVGNAKRFVDAELGLKDGKHVKVEVRSAGKEVLVHVLGLKLIYSLDAVPFERFKKKAEDYRFRRLLTFDEKNAITEFTLRFPRERKEVILKKTGEIWQPSVALKEPVSQARVKDFLDSLAGLDAQGFTRDPAKWKKFAALADLELVIGKQTYRFVLDGKNSALANGDFIGEARIMGEDFLKALPVRVTDLYESANKKIVTKEPDVHVDEHQH